jgi:hypothetical protein
VRQAAAGRLLGPGPEFTENIERGLFHAASAWSLATVSTTSVRSLLS